MRSAVAIAALAAGALAAPYKRDVVTDVDVVYATDIVTVWATSQETSTAAAQATSTVTAESSATAEEAYYGHHWSPTYSAPSSPSSTSEAPTTPSTTTTPTSTYVPPPPTSTTPTSTYVPPPPPTSTYVAPTTSSTSTWATSTSSSSSSAAPTTYSDLVVYHHNLHRANHSAPDLEWSDDLASSAQTIAASCVYAHNVDVAGGGYGQNIAAGVESNNISAIITDLFYNGEVNSFPQPYGQAQPDMTNFDAWGHFSQIVWKATTAVGCATQYCPNGLGNVGSDVAPYFTVCNYKSPGNYANEYGDNIGTPLNHPTADWNTGS